MRKRFRIVIVSIVALVTVAVLAGLVFHAAGGVGWWLESSIVAALAERNVRAEIAKTDVTFRPGTVVIEGLALYPGQEATPLVTVERIDVAFDIRSLWSRTVDVSSIELRKPVVTVTFDEHGRSNLDAIRLPDSGSGGSADLTALRSAVVTVHDGRFVYGDKANGIDGTLANLMLSIAPKADSPQERRLEASFSESDLTVNGRAVPGIGMQLAADVGESGARVENVAITTPLGTVTLAGTIASWRDVSYDFAVGSTVAMDRVGALVDPAAGLSGAAALNGRITGTGPKYRFEGELSGDNLLVSGARVEGLRVSGPVEGTGAAYSWGVGELVASRLTLAGYDVSDVRFAGRVDGTGSQAVANGTATAGAIHGGGASGAGASFTGTVTSDGARMEGAVALNSLAVRTVRAGSIRARVTVDGDTLDVPDFSAVVYGGAVRGSARARLSESGRSTLEATFRDIDIDQAAGAASADAPRVRGRASGTVSLTWPGTRIQSSTGSVHATVDGSVDGEHGAWPVDGTIALSARPGMFVIETADFESGGSSFTADGTIGWDRRADIRVTANARDGSELLGLVSAANPILGRQLATYEVRIGGGFDFNGHVTGAVTNPSVDGTVTVGSVAVGEEEIGAFSGRFHRDGAGVEVSDARLVRSQGGELAFELSLPVSEARSQRFTARINRFPLVGFFEPLPGPVSPELAKVGGLVSGSVDIRVPAGTALGEIAGAARGTVDVEVAGAVAAGEPLDEFRLAADLGDSDVQVTTLRIGSARGSVTGSGRFVRESRAYRFDFDGSGVDLKLLEAFAATPGQASVITLAGTAGGKLTVAGAFVGAETRVTELTGDVAAADVSVNGEPVGDPRLTIATDKSVATLRLAADVRGQRREISGTVDMNDPDLPFHFAAGLENFDAMSLVANRPPGVTTRLAGNVVVSGFLGDVSSEKGIRDRLAVNGSLATLELRVDAGDAGKTYELANEGEIGFGLTGSVVHFDHASFKGQGTALTLAGDLALDETAVSNLTLAGDVSLALVSSFARQAYADGVATLQATVAGTLAEPRFSGFADVRGASLRIVNVPVAIQEGEGRILFTSNQALIDRFTARANGGTVDLDGGVLFDGLTPSRWRFGISASQVRLTYPEDVRSVVDGRLTLQGNRQLMVLGGGVTVRRAEFTRDIDAADFLKLEERGSGATFGNRPARTSTSPIRLDVTVDARDSLIVRNNLADVVASASLVITGPIDDPTIDGRATVSHGTLQFRDGEYQVTRGVVRFPGRLGGDITFDLLAESEIKGYRVSIGLTGTPGKPYPVLRSEPPLPETQVASLVLTGDLASEEISASTVAQSSVGVASSLLSEAVSRSVEKRTSKLFGINRFQIDPLVGRSDPSARLTVGRRVNKNLSIIYSTNLSASQEQVIQLEYRISDRFSLVATRDEDGALGLDFRVRKRF